MPYGNFQQPNLHGYVPSAPEYRPCYPSHSLPNQYGHNNQNYSVDQIPTVWKPQQTKLYKLEPPTFDGDPKMANLLGQISMCCS